MQKIKMMMNKYQEIISYLIVGALTTLISLISYYALVLTILNPNNSLELQIANIISWIISVLFAYITNRKFVFKSQNKNIFKEFFSFTSSRIITLLCDMLIMYLGVTVLNYIISKFFVFQNKKKTLK